MTKKSSLNFLFFLFRAHISGEKIPPFLHSFSPYPPPLQRFSFPRRLREDTIYTAQNSYMHCMPPPYFPYFHFHNEFLFLSPNGGGKGGGEGCYVTLLLFILLLILIFRTGIGWAWVEKKTKIRSKSNEIRLLLRSGNKKKSSYCPYPRVCRYRRGPFSGGDRTRRG
jgi:hypothetical protein